MAPWRNRWRDPVIQAIPKNAVCAEIGVWKGEFSWQILRKARPYELHLIDPWLFTPEYPNRWYGGKKAASQSDMDKIYDDVLRRFSRYSQVRIHRMASVVASHLFPDQTFDWVYIDGDHSFEAVKNDLFTWHKKVRPGGHMVGDDFDWRDEHGRLSVKDAVETFLFETKLRAATVKDGQFSIPVST